MLVLKLLTLQMISINECHEVLPLGPLARVLVTPDDNDLRLRSLTTDGAT